VLNAKFEVSSSNRSRHMEGLPKFQKQVTWTLPDPLWPNFDFLFVTLLASRCAKYEVCSSNRSRYMEGVPKFQKEVVWPRPDPFDLILYFLSLVSLAVNQHVKFEVSSSNRPRYGGRPKIRKVGHVTHSQSVSKWSAVTIYLDSSTPICLLSRPIQLSWGQWRRVVSAEMVWAL